MYGELLLGVIQGVVEWIPISSEGVVTLLGSSFAQNPLNLALFLHLGTLFAVLIYFRKDWITLLKGKDPKLFKFLVITTLISLAIGFPLHALVSSLAVGVGILFLMGFALLATSFLQRKQMRVNAGKFLPYFAGIMQGLAVIPGLSRSGSTIFALSLSEYSSKEILRISYLMSAPIVVASSAYLLLVDETLLSAWPALITSFLVGIASLQVIMKWIEHINFSKFTFVFGILCILGGVLSLL